MPNFEKAKTELDEPGKKARTQFTKTLLENLEADFGNPANQKINFAEQTDFDE